MFPTEHRPTGKAQVALYLARGAESPGRNRRHESVQQNPMYTTYACLPVRTLYIVHLIHIHSFKQTKNSRILHFQLSTFCHISCRLHNLPSSTKSTQFPQLNLCASRNSIRLFYSIIRHFAPRRAKATLNNSKSFSATVVVPTCTYLAVMLLYSM
jgi:hypothetical protein